MADIDEHGRKGRRDQQRFGAWQDRAHDRRIGRETGREPDREPPAIGNRGDEKGDREEERRVMPAIERHLAPAEHGLFGGMLQRRLVGPGGAALPGQAAGGVDVGKVGADRLAVAVDQAVRQRDPAATASAQMPSRIRL